MKQTAVEWLVENLDIIWEEKIIDLVEQARAIEKEQIIEAASNTLAKEAYRAGQDSMYCGCYEIDGCTNYEEWIYKKQTNKE